MAFNLDSYRQKEFAQHVFGHGLQAESYGKQGYELKLLAVYLRDECGMSDKEIREYLIKFCEKEIEGYHFRRHYKLIETACKYAKDKKNVLIQVDSLPVYQEEVMYIDSLDISYDEKKLMFSILMLKKLDRECFEQRNGGEYKMAYLAADEQKLCFLKKAAGTSSKLDIPKDVFYHWREKGYIRVSFAGFILDFMDQMEHNGIEIMQIKHYDCFGAYWDLLFNGDKVTTCKVCSKPIKKTSANKCYCKEHMKFTEPTVAHKTKQMECGNCGRKFFVSAHAVKARICPSCARKE